MAFGGSRGDDLKVVLEKTYLTVQAEPILNMMALDAIEEMKAPLKPIAVVAAFKRGFSQDALLGALGKPYEGRFSNAEMKELRKICESPVWQKYAQEGTAIMAANLDVMRSAFRNLCQMQIPIAGIWQITEDNFDQVAASDLPVIIDVNASWCHACQAMAPVFDEVSGEYEGKVQFAKMDIDAEPALAKKFKIHSLPTLLFFKAGHKTPTMKSVGALDKEQFEAKIDSFLKTAL